MVTQFRVTTVLGSLLNSRFTLLLFAGGVCILGEIAHQYHLIASAILIALASIFWRQTSQVLRLLDRFPGYAQVLCMSLITFLGVINFCIEPANAVFLDKACGLLDSVFSGTASTGGGQIDPVKMTINLLRGMFLVYLVVALIQVFHLMRQEEDWHTAARAPLIAVLIVAVADVISGMVIPGNGGTC